MKIKVHRFINTAGSQKKAAKKRSSTTATYRCASAMEKRDPTKETKPVYSPGSSPPTQGSTEQQLIVNSCNSTTTTTASTSAESSSGSPVLVGANNIKQQQQQQPSTTTTDHGIMRFRCDSQFSRAFLEMNSLRQTEQLCDVVLEVEGETVTAHRVVLASLSAYFRAMFTQQMAESKQRLITINGVDPSTLKSLVEYAYTATIDISEDNVQSILSAASVLQFQEVKQACSEFLRRQLDTDNCLGIKVFAEAHGCNDLQKAATVYSSHYFSQVRRRDEFLKLSIDEIKLFLSNEQLNVKSEYEVYEAAMAWLNHEADRRAEHLYEVLRLVRLPQLSTEQLLEEVGHNPLVLSNPKCVELFVEAMQSLLLPDSKAKIDAYMLRPRKPEERLYAIGGWDGNSAVKMVEYFDTETNQWEIGTPTKIPRNGVGLAILNGALYAIGGHDGQKFQNSVEVFDPRLNKWQSVAPLKHRRASAGLVIHDNFIYAIGGQDGTLRLKSAERYNPTTNEWESIANMNMRRDSPGVVAHGEFIYAIGGCHACMFLDTVEKYDPKLNRWFSAMHMSHRRSAVGAVALNGHIYVFGGHDERSNLCVLERYDPETNTWATLSSMNSPRAGVGAAILDKKIVAVGGFDGAEQLNTVEQYDPDTDTWSYMQPMRYERSYVGAVSTIKIV